jgi:hypothetical protein
VSLPEPTEWQHIGNQIKAMFYYGQFVPTPEATHDSEKGRD